MQVAKCLSTSNFYNIYRASDIVSYLNLVKRKAERVIDALNLLQN